MPPKMTDTRPCCLYRIVHRDTGLDYVGASTVPQTRWTQHKWEALNPNTAPDADRSSSAPKFHSFLAEQGPEAFDWNIIAWASCYKGACQLEEMARHLGMGALNITKGGAGTKGRALSDKTANALIESNRSRVWTPEAREKQAADRRGKTMPVTATAKISASLIGRPKSPQAVANMKQAQALRRERERQAKLEKKES